ncbi:MAG: magnesium transporter [Syntrophobacter sp. DG_60]|nr:MAG: magnesium transporter [Syntrophobacter sp. DG_60]
MFKFIKRTSKKIGLPPGALIYIGEKKVEKAKITIIDYDEAQFHEKEAKTIEECFPFKDKPTVTWINIDGIHEVEIIEKLGKHFNIHPLILEDIVHTGQRPKMEDFGDYIFVVLKMLYYNEKDDEIKAEQVSLILGLNFVISFQETEGDVFNPIRERIRNGKGRITKKGADYLGYALMDAVVDHYFIILEKIGEKIEDMEEELVTNPTPETLQAIHNLKREMIFLRKSVWPLREMISGLERAESSLIQESTRIYLRDVYDHTIQVIDTIESFRDMVYGMLDTYLSSISNRMNEVMKVLTIIATIFIPLTFIAGVYGMNFAYMPELKWHWFYPKVFWLVMVAIIGFMAFYFKRKKWL